MRFPAHTATLRSHEYETHDQFNKRCGVVTRARLVALRLTSGDGLLSINLAPNRRVAQVSDAVSTGAPRLASETWDRGNASGEGFDFPSRGQKSSKIVL
jgi:hypothetical protein